MRFTDELADVIFVVTLLMQAVAGAAAQCSPAAEPHSGTAATALALCREADQYSGAEKQHILQQGLNLAQDAAAADPRDARAHFAVFCALGKQLQSRPLAPHDLAVIHRLRMEIDTVLMLAPQDEDALIAKGAMLLALPWFLGGDGRQGEELLRTALNQDPSNVAARRYLADALRSRGAEDELHGLETLAVGTAAPPEVLCAQAAGHDR